MKELCPIVSATQKYSSNIAFSLENLKVSFNEANLLVGGVAKKLAAMKLGKRVSVVSNNNLEMVILLFALQRVGVSAVLHNTRLKSEDWKEQARLAETEIAFVSQEFKDASPFTETYLLPSLDSKEEFQAEVDFEKEAVVMFTSGSTGIGKGVRLSLGNLLSSAKASNLVNDLSASDTWLASLPFFHVGGLCIIFRTLLAGASSLIAEAKQTENLLDQISHVSLVPSVLREVAQSKDKFNKLKKLKNILLGGAPSDFSFLEKIKELPLRTSYGMTETSSHVCMLEKKKIYELEDLKTSGNLLQGVEVKISEESEICLKGPNVFLGYLGQKQRSANEWFHTGDLGKLDSSGRLIVEGRKDRTIISGGENINPKQIEDIALACNGVQEAVVIGVDDLKWGQRPIVFIVAEKEFDISALSSLFQQKLPKFKIPDRIECLEAIPKTAIGKVDYKRLLQ